MSLSGNIFPLCSKKRLHAGPVATWPCDDVVTVFVVCLLCVCDSVCCVFVTVFVVCLWQCLLCVCDSVCCVFVTVFVVCLWLCLLCVCDSVCCVFVTVFVVCLWQCLLCVCDSVCDSVCCVCDSVCCVFVTVFVTVFVVFVTVFVVCLWQCLLCVCDRTCGNRSTSSRNRSRSWRRRWRSTPRDWRVPRVSGGFTWLLAHPQQAGFCLVWQGGGGGTVPSAHPVNFSSYTHLLIYTSLYLFTLHLVYFHLYSPPCTSLLVHVVHVHFQFSISVHLHFHSWILHSSTLPTVYTSFSLHFLIYTSLSLHFIHLHLYLPVHFHHVHFLVYTSVYLHFTHLHFSSCTLPSSTLPCLHFPLHFIHLHFSFIIYTPLSTLHLHPSTLCCIFPVINWCNLTRWPCEWRDSI